MIPSQLPLLVAQASPEAAGGDSFLDIVFSGGISGFLIVALLLLLSIGGLALGVEHALTIRRRVMTPPGLAERLTAALGEGKLAPALEVCQSEPCTLSALVKTALGEVDGGWAAVEKALEEEAAEQAGRLYRKIEYLSLLGNIAPMVGLLGTVVGMIFAFQEVAETQGAARAAELASGIYQALVTTVGGLLIAIPALSAFAVFRNRVDQLMADAVLTARQVLRPVKRALLGRRTAPPPAPAR